MPCGIASSPERGELLVRNFSDGRKCRFPLRPLQVGLSRSADRDRHEIKTFFPLNMATAKRGAILNQNYELFTYPCLRRHKLLRGFQVRPTGAAVAATFRMHWKRCWAAAPILGGAAAALDAGVHALGFRLNFHADTCIPPPRAAAGAPTSICRRISGCLAAQTVPEDFHARYAAHTTDLYLYRIHNHPIDSPFDAASLYRVSPARLDEAAMQAAASSSWAPMIFWRWPRRGGSAAAHGVSAPAYHHVLPCHPARGRGGIEVTADGYLYNMVRILAGTL